MQPANGVIAAVVADVSAGSIATAQADSERFIEDCLKRAGIRLVRITATTPPLPDAVRALVIEAAEQAGGRAGKGG